LKHLHSEHVGGGHTKWSGITGGSKKNGGTQRKENNELRVDCSCSERNQAYETVFLKRPWSLKTGEGHPRNDLFIKMKEGKHKEFGGY